MPPKLTQIKRDFLARLCGAPDPRLEGERFAAYQRIEAMVIDAIDRLRQFKVDGERADSVERDVQVVQTEVNNATNRESATRVLGWGVKTLEGIHARVAELLKRAEGYDSALNLAQEHFRALPRDGANLFFAALSKAISDNYIGRARELAAASQRFDAYDLLIRVGGKCAEAHELAQAYDQAFAVSKATRIRLDKKILAEAVRQAEQGHTDAALGLIARAKHRCQNPPNADLAGATELVDRYLRELEALDEFDGLKEAFKEETASLNARLANMRELAANGLATKSTKSEGEVPTDDMRQEGELLYCEGETLIRLANSHKRYLEARETARSRLKEVRDQAPRSSNKAIEKEIEAIGKELALARQRASERAYDLAHEALGRVTHTLCPHAADLKQGHARYSQRLGPLEYEVSGHLSDQDSNFAPEAMALRELLDSAVTLAEVDRNYRGASVQLELVGIACRKLDALRNELRNDSERLQDLTLRFDSDDPTPHADAMEHALELFNALRTRAGSEAIAEEMLDEMDTLIKTAGREPSKAKAAMKQFHGVYLRAASLAARHCVYGDEYDAVLDNLLAATNREASVGGQIAEANHLLEQASQHAHELDHAGAFALLGRVRKKTEEIQHDLGRVQAIRTKVEQLKSWVGHSRRLPDEMRSPDLRSDVDLVDDLCAVIGTKLSSPGNIEAAELDLAFTEMRYRFARTKLAAATPGSSPQAVRDELAELQRAGQLDDFVGSMPREGHPEIVLWALEKRLQLPDGAYDWEEDSANRAGVVELQAIYKALTEVPRGHTKEIRKVVRNIERSSYNYATKVLKIGKGPESLFQVQILYSAETLPDVPREWQPVEDAKPSAFQFAMWHEIGHALDDRLNFMQRHGKDQELGGWRHHGSNVMEIAHPLADVIAFQGIDAKAIGTYLIQGIEPDGKAPGGQQNIRDTKQWQLVMLWANRVRDYRDPWLEGRKNTQSVLEGGFVIGDRIYHEAYPSEWVSYRKDARAKGLRSNQFRGAGEWFADLYAVFKAGALPPTHPHYQLIQALVDDPVLAQG